MYFDWIATIFSLIGIVFNAKRSIWCWPTWLVGSIVWVLYYLFGTDKIQWASVILWSTFICANLYGWWNWWLVKKWEKNSF